MFEGKKVRNGSELTIRLSDVFVAKMWLKVVRKRIPKSWPKHLSSTTKTTKPQATSLTSSELLMKKRKAKQNPDGTLLEITKTLVQKMVQRSGAQWPMVQQLQ